MSFPDEIIISIFLYIPYNINYGLICKYFSIIMKYVKDISKKSLYLKYKIDNNKVSNKRYIDKYLNLFAYKNRWDLFYILMEDDYYASLDISYIYKKYKLAEHIYTNIRQLNIKSKHERNFGYVHYSWIHNSLDKEELLISISEVCIKSEPEFMKGYIFNELFFDYYTDDILIYMLSNNLISNYIYDNYIKKKIGVSKYSNWIKNNRLYSEYDIEYEVKMNVMNEKYITQEIIDIVLWYLRNYTIPYYINENENIVEYIFDETINPILVAEIINFLIENKNEIGYKLDINNAISIINEYGIKI